MYQYHDESIIQSLAEHHIFVFASNLAGKHEYGAAKTAYEHFGAMMGSGRGWAGQSYAIPTQNEHFQAMPLHQIEHYIQDFKVYTQNHAKFTYFVTAIGCGKTGFEIKDIAPLFKGISNNVILPIRFKPFLTE